MQPVQSLSVHGLTHLLGASLGSRADGRQQVLLLGTSDAALLQAIVEGLGEDAPESRVPLAGLLGRLQGWCLPDAVLGPLSLLSERRLGGLTAASAQEALWLDPSEECGKDLQHEWCLTTQAALQPRHPIGMERRRLRR